MKRAVVGTCLVLYFLYAIVWRACRIEESISILRFLEQKLDGNLTFQDSKLIAKDFGNMYSYPPIAVLQPGSIEDIALMVKSVYTMSSEMKIAARGHSHSLLGQAMAHNGVVIHMSSHRGIQVHSKNVEFPYVEVHAGELWIDVLQHCLKYGLTPRSWTDYLYLSVGGTLSNAGISGQAFRHGPQISNVHHLQIVTGKGEVLNCSRKQNADLFHGALGGLGQFGIITSASIALEEAPHMVKWMRVLYSDFDAFISDQEHLIRAFQKPYGFDYIEGFVIISDNDLLNNWRSSLFRQSNPSMRTLDTKGRVLYCLEMAKYYNKGHEFDVEKEVSLLLEILNFIPFSLFTADVSYVEFLDRVYTGELKLRSEGQWDIPHPWINLLIPKSKILEFDKLVFKSILNETSSGPVLIFPMNLEKWDNKMSAVTPNEDVFYLVGFLRSCMAGDTQGLQRMLSENEEIKSIAERIGGKQYLPHYTSQEKWRRHFGGKWEVFVRRKMLYDPHFIMTPGQRIFSNSKAIYSL